MPLLSTGLGGDSGIGLSHWLAGWSLSESVLGNTGLVLDSQLLIEASVLQPSGDTQLLEGPLGLLPCLLSRNLHSYPQDTRLAGTSLGKHGPVGEGAIASTGGCGCGLRSL